MYYPDWDGICRICGTSPTVIVAGHPHMPDTELCGVHFWHDQEMVDWQEWNNQEDPPTEEES